MFTPTFVLACILGGFVIMALIAILHTDKEMNDLKKKQATRNREIEDRLTKLEKRFDTHIHLNR